MDILFVPKRLKEEQQQIKLDHPYVDGRKHVKMYENKELRKLIEKLVKMVPQKLKKEAYALSDSQLAAVAAYIPSNAFSVKRDNLHQILYYRSDKWFWDIYLDAWQNYYFETECNDYLCKNVLHDDALQEALTGRHFNAAAFTGILKKDNIPISLGRYMYSNEFPIKGMISERLNYIGVRKDTRLYNKCEALYYIFCGHDDYCNAEKERILTAVKNYDDEEMLAFMKNFLGILSLVELDEFRKLGLYFQQAIGDQTNYRFQKLSGLPDDLKQKYLDWLNRLWIDTYFGNDERSVFWREYHFKTIRKNSFSNSLTMEFNNHYVVEFLGERNGPLYIYDKVFFDKEIRRWTERETNQDLRQTLLYKDRTFRQVHGKGWQWKVREFVRRYNIAERIS